MCEGLCGSWRASLGIWFVCFRCLKVGLCPVAVGGGGGVVGGGGAGRLGEAMWKGGGSFFPPAATNLGFGGIAATVLGFHT